MNQKMDLQVPALILEKILALVATHLNVESVELVLITTGKHNSSFCLVAPHKHRRECGENHVQEIGSILKQLRAIAKQFNCAMNNQEFQSTQIYTNYRCHRRQFDILCGGFPNILN